MKLFFSFFLLLISAKGFSQGFIGKTRIEVREGWQNFLLKHWVSVDLNEYDSLMTFNVNDSVHKHADFIYVFDKEGKCNTEIKIACDECISKFLKDNLRNRKYKWLAANDSVYNSAYAGGLKMEKFKLDTSYLLRIRKSD